MTFFLSLSRRLAGVVVASQYRPGRWLPIPNNEHAITHVSDTARWTALHRATESARPDALFHDPLAERLSGEHGRAIAAGVPRMSRNGWWLVARTKIIDDAIAGAIADGCDRMLNLAAGLDTRPYRLDLPPNFTWIEADLPALLAEKTELLADQTPRCELTRTAVDLADPPARRAFFDDALNGATKAMVLTEGLTMYLEDHDVVGLSEAIKQPKVGWWMLDFAGPGLRRAMNKSMAGIKEHAPFKFAPENGLAYFEDLGWHTVEAGIAICCCPSAATVAIVHACGRLVASTRSASPGQPAVECGCSAQPVTSPEVVGAFLYGLLCKIFTANSHV